MVKTNLTVEEFMARLEQGPCAWPGGYPLYGVCEDGGALSFGAMQDNAEGICLSIHHGCTDEWRVVAVEVNWEDAYLFCEHTGERIESAYAEDDGEGGAQYRTLIERDLATVRPAVRAIMRDHGFRLEGMGGGHNLWVRGSLSGGAAHLCLSAGEDACGIDEDPAAPVWLIGLHGNAGGFVAVGPVTLPAAIIAADRLVRYQHYERLGRLGHNAATVEEAEALFA